MLEKSRETLSTGAVARTFLSKTSLIVHLWQKPLLLTGQTFFPMTLFTSTPPFES